MSLTDDKFAPSTDELYWAQRAQQMHRRAQKAEGLLRCLVVRHEYHYGAYERGTAYSYGFGMMRLTEWNRARMILAHSRGYDDAEAKMEPKEVGSGEGGSHPAVDRPDHGLSKLGGALLSSMAMERHRSKIRELKRFLWLHLCADAILLSVVIQHLMGAH